MRKKLIVVDVDATLIDSPQQKIPSRRVIELIWKLQDKVLVTCATGRSLSWALPVLQAAKFTAPPILWWGTYILNIDDLSISHKFELPQYKLQEIKDILSKYRDVHVLYNDYTEADYLAGWWNLQGFLDLKECWMMEVVMISHETADKLIEYFQKITWVTSVKMNSFKEWFVDIHIVHENATKEHAIWIIQRELWISKKDTIWVWDGYNDFHIFNAVGTKVAVWNAVEWLKELADEIIDDVKNDPIAQLLERYI